MVERHVVGAPESSPQVTELRVDLDGPAPKWWRRFAFLARMWRLEVETVCFARSQRGGLHVMIQVRNNVSPVRMVAMQACLGSDPIREAINLVRVNGLTRSPRFWRGRWNVLYERYWVSSSSQRRRQR